MMGRSFIRDLVLIGAAAFVVRIVFLLVQTRFAVFDVAFVASDSQLYLRLADGIRSGAGYSIDGHPTAVVGPVYPLFLAGLRAAGLDATGIGAAQSVLGALTACFAAAAAGHLSMSSGSRTPRRSLMVSAGATCALYPHLVFWTGFVLTETLFVFLMSGSLVILFASAIAQRGSGAFASGVLAAAAALTRSPFLAVAVLLACWLGYAVIRRELRPAVAMFFVVGLTIPLLAWTARNMIELGAPIVTTTQSGFFFYVANSARSTGGDGGDLNVRDFPDDAPPNLDEVHRDSFYFARTLDDIRADPTTFVARTGPKVWNMWRPTYEGASFRNEALTIGTYLPLLVLGAIGAVTLARAAPVPIGAMLFLALTAWILLHAVVGGLIRYRLPAEFLLSVAAPFGAAMLMTLTARRRDSPR